MENLGHMQFSLWDYLKNRNAPLNPITTVSKRKQFYSRTLHKWISKIATQRLYWEEKKGKHEVNRYIDGMKLTKVSNKNKIVHSASPIPSREKKLEIFLRIITYTTQPENEILFWNRHKNSLFALHISICLRRKFHQFPSLERTKRMKIMGNIQFSLNTFKEFFFQEIAHTVSYYSCPST